MHLWNDKYYNQEIKMIQKISIQGNTKHVFTAEKDFLMQPDWILQVKGPEAKAIWDKIGEEVDPEMDPDYNETYEEWISYYGITHTITTLDEAPK